MKTKQWHLILLILPLLFISSFARAANVATGVTVVVAPDAPSDFTAIPASPTQVALSWTVNSNNLEDGFNVERKTGVAGSYLVIGTTATGIATYVDNSAAAGTTYFYRVRAFTGNIYSSYSNEASVTTPIPSTPPATPTTNPSSGGGGGGAGGSSVYTSPASTNNSVSISGWAYPLSTVTILQNGVQVLQTIADPSGAFTGSISDFPDGSYNFYLYATDSSGHKSTPFTFPVSVTTGASTDISSVFIAPTIAVDKKEVKQGNPIVIFGQSLPNTPIKIEVDSAVPIIAHTTSSASGVYTYDFDSSELEMGSHIAKVEADFGGLLSNYSVAQAFTVGDENVAAPAAVAGSQCPEKGDLNGDCKVNLVDFSILAYWYGRSAAPAVYLLDGGSAVDLRDFSIMAYYWTG